MSILTEDKTISDLNNFQDFVRKSLKYKFARYRYI